ncbi:hypothetical protein BGX12_1624 [Fibrobacter sp. UWR4]|uniref:hypothetical protein n=1 Tax=Fibrobacter sp. UWR4 TaxID=1896218 RepID=UPI000D6B61CB|nr:hypothetical protein [Fibrobacter sp. UWR4]PWJ56682.1 hypothetical protein BGX12_1624 [Fibrobacter sp. UWR4]
MPDGTTLYFGNTENSKRTQLSRGNVITAYSADTVGLAPFIYRYDLSKVTDFNETTEIKFEYSKVQETIVQGKSYTRESALSSVYWRNGETTIDSIALMYSSMNAEEYPGYGTTESKDSQRLYETRYLSKIRIFVQGNFYEELALSQRISHVQDFADKRYLQAVRDSIIGGEARSWAFHYNASNGLLDQIVLPDNSVDNFSYTNISFDLLSDAQSPSDPDTMRNISGAQVQIPVAERENYRNGVSCTEEFCYATLTNAKSGDRQDLYVQIYHNDGNYFSSPFNFQMSGKIAPRLFISSNYFILADVEGRDLNFYEWNGFRFVQQNSVIGDFFETPTELSGTIENIIVQDNYFLVVEKDGDIRRIYPIVRHPSTGNWTLLPKDKSVCGFSNTSDYGDQVRSSSNACLEWSSAIAIDASPTLFIVGENDKDVLNVFAYKDGSFDELTSNAAIFPDFGIQKKINGVTYTMNFQKGLDGIALSGNTLFVTLNKGDTEYIVSMFFDGKKFQEMANEHWDDGTYRCGGDAFCGDRFVIMDNFVVEISNAKGNVFLWRKKRSNEGVFFELDRNGIFPFDGANDNVFVSVTRDALYLEERYASTRPVIQNGRYHNLLIRIPRDPTSPISYCTSELDSSVFDLQFSQSDPIVFYQTGLTEGGKLCPQGVLCYVSGYSLHRNFSEDRFFLASKFFEQPLNYSFHSTTSQTSYSAPNRLMAKTVVDSNSSRNLIGLAQYSGHNFWKPQNYSVVDRYWKERSTDSTNRYTQFTYVQPNGIVEFNAHTQQAQFIAPVVNTVAFVSNDTVTKTRYDFIADLKWKTLVGYQKNLQGTLSKTRHYDRSGMLRSSSRNVFALDSGVGRNWPNGLVVNLLDSTISTTFDPIGNKISVVDKNVLLDNESGQFMGTLRQSGPYFLFSQKILERQKLNRNPDSVIFKNPVAQYSYVPFTTSPLTAIQSSNPSQVFLADSVASASKVSYSSDFPGAAISSYVWQAPIRVGQAFPISTGWEKADSVIATDSYGHVTESVRLTNVGLRSSCNVFEGHRSLLTGSFIGAACADVALSTAEHGTPNGWEMPQTTIDSVQVYDGLYSFKVTDGYGPTRNISLKELHRYKYSYVISAFAYSTGVKPVLMTEFRRADKTIAKTIASYNPVREPFKINRWQRYEIEIPYSELVSNGMFADSSADDHLRVWLGTGTPTGDASRIIYVDDFVAYPSSAAFTMTSYDRAGHPLSAMGMDFQKNDFVYDKNHRRRATRDPKGRIFTDNAKHLLKENMGGANE